MIFQNVSNYLVLFVGVIFANLLLFFGMLLPSALDHYQLEIQENMLAKYQYMLSVPASVSSGNKLDGMISLWNIIWIPERTIKMRKNFPPIP